jgi:hypothetical protein
MAIEEDQNGCYGSDGKDPWLSGYDYAGREVSLVKDY